jgi:glycosyltransferase involved in cell wall biosynthesis
MEIGKRLVGKGHEVHVFTLQYDGCLPKEEFIDGIVVHRYAYSRSYISREGFRTVGGVLKYSLASFTQLLGQSYDVYYSNQWPMLHSVFVKPVATPLIQEWCEVWTNSLRVTILQRLVKSIGDYHVAVSEFTRRRLSFLKIDPKKVTVVPNGVNFSRFCSGSNDKVWGRIVYVGRVVPHKHVELLVDAFREVKKKVPEVELHVVGSGSSLSSVKRRAMDVKDCFIYGFLSEERMVELLKSAWLFVLPSEREGSGIGVLEAMAAGVPFLTVSYPDNAAKELSQFRCGVVVDPAEVSIASAIIQLFNNEGLWKMMSVNALDFAKKHDWNIITDRMESFFNMVVNNDEK